MKINCDEFRRANICPLFANSFAWHVEHLIPDIYEISPRLRMIMGDSLSEYSCFATWNIIFQERGKVSTVRFTYVSAVSALLASPHVHLWLIPHRDPARDSDNALNDFSSRRNACYRLYHALYRVYKTARRGGRAAGERELRLYRGATGDFVTRSYSWSILGLQVR